MNLRVIIFINIMICLYRHIVIIQESNWKGIIIMRNKTKLYLLTGFLGAGKTTFLTNVLNDLSGSKVAVIMNEFGKIGIDGTNH